MKNRTAPEKINTKTDEEIQKQRIAEEQKQRLEQKRRRTVHGAIMDLTETVNAAELNLALNVLDVNSWMEVMEERFLARICGWPLCSQPLNVPVRKQKYKLDKANQKVYQTYSINEKFCSLICLKNHENVKSELNELPLWLTGDRQQKNYNLFADHHQNDVPMNENDKPDEVLELSKQNDGAIEYIPDKLLVQLHSLHIAENAAESSSDEETGEADDANAETGKNKEDDRLFLSNIHSFVSSKSLQSERTKEKPCTIKKKLENATDTEMEEKLARLRLKWGKQPLSVQKKSPVFVEPHFMEPSEIVPATTSEPVILKPKLDKNLESTLEKLKEWITPETLLFVEDAGLPQENPLLEQFFSAILDPRDYQKMKEKEEETKSVKLPLVDNIDIHYRRVDIVLLGIKKSWQSLLGQIQINFPVRHAKDLVSTFNLTKNNCVVDVKKAMLLTTLLFHLMLMFNAELKSTFERKETLDSYDKYLKSMSLQRKTINKSLNDLLESKKARPE